MTLVLDVGGTNIRAELYKDQEYVASFSAKSSAIGLAAYIEDLIEQYREIKTVCISYAGQVREGVILSAPNIEIDRHEIEKYFRKKHGIRLFIDNDLNCALLAEADYFNSKNICALYIGTGLGLGALSEGVIIRGATNVATELGHIPYKKAPFLCGCGRDNCIELFASGSALTKWKRHDNLDANLTLEDLRHAKQPEAKKIYEEFEEALLYALGTVITLFNPEIVVLGGGIVSQNADLCDRLQNKIESYAFAMSLKQVKIIVTKLENAPLIGARLLKDKNE